MRAALTELWPYLTDLYNITPENFTAYSPGELGRYIDDIPAAIDRRRSLFQLT